MRQETPWKRLTKSQEDWLPPHDEWLGPRLASLLGELTRRQREVLFLRYVLELTQAEASGVLGVNQQRISVVERQALKKLKMTLPTSIARRFVGFLEKLPRSKRGSREPFVRKPAGV